MLALDDSADRPVLWFGSGKDFYREDPRPVLRRIEDLGDSFGQPADIKALAGNSGEGTGPVMAMALDRAGRKLLINEQSYDLAAGRFGPGMKDHTGMYQGIGSFGLDGNFYMQSWPLYVYRFGPDLKPLPFPQGVDKQRKQQYPGALKCPLYYDSRLRMRGVAADAQGNVYVLWQWILLGFAPGEYACVLYKYDREGRLLKEYLIDSEIQDLTSVRVDYQGNIYVALSARPGHELIPPSLKDRIPNAKNDPDTVAGYNYYSLLYGSILKFGPEGGKILPEKQYCGAAHTKDPEDARKCRRHWQQDRSLPREGSVLCNHGWGGKEILVQGARWIFSGASPQPDWYDRPMLYMCNCDSSRFDVDGFGRVFFPDACQFRAGVLDTNGNLVAWFGSYGNQDSAGPGSKAPQPEIAFYWPWLVCVDDGRAYVGDRLNRRVVAVKLDYAAEAACPVP